MDNCVKKNMYADFTVDSIVNVASVFVLGICGFMINIVIARYYDAATLGVFNQVYAIYIFSSQLSTLGVQMSTLKYVAEFSENQDRCNSIISAALIIAAAAAILAVAILYILRFLIADVFGSNTIAKAIVYILPGLWFFSLNKVFFSVLNGFSHLKMLAFFSTLRYVSLLVALLWLVASGYPGECLVFIFSVTEGLLFVALLLSSFNHFSLSLSKKMSNWFCKHLVFGSKGILGGVFHGLNMRIDVLILGLFVSDRTVGIYSFAAVIIDGISQIPYAIRRILDPRIAKFVAEGNFASMAEMISKMKRIFLGSMLAIGVLGVITYQPFVFLVVRNFTFQEGWPVFIILMFGLVVLGTYIPFSGLLLQSGYPELHTMYVGCALITNAILNVILIPFLGMHGAAVGTSLSLILSVWCLRKFSWKAIRFKL